MRKLWLIGCSVLLFASLSLAQKQSADEEMIRKLDAEWSAAAQSRNVEKTVSYYADDASVLGDRVPIATGKAQVHELWTQMLSSPGVKLSFGPTKVELAKAKDIAYEIGTYQMTGNDPKGNPVNEVGKYVVVWKKQPNKQWKVAVDIFNPDK